MSILKTTDWYQDLDEYIEENRIVEVLEEDDDIIDKPYFGVDYDPDRFDSDTFSIWSDT